MRSPPPPLPFIPLLSIRRLQRWISVTASIWRLWVCELILDSDGDHFFFSLIFCRTSVSRDIDCYSLAKISEILAGANICRCQYLCVFCMAGHYNKPVQCGRESAHKSRAASGSSTLNCTWRYQQLQGEVGEHQRGVGKVSCCRLCRAKTVRRCFRVCANILLKRRFCRRPYFVDGNILLTPTFNRHQYFVDANILSTPTFCWCQHFVDANILLAPIFCRCQYYVCV